MKYNCRFIAATLVADVLQGNSLTKSLSRLTVHYPTLSTRDHALLQMIAYGVCRYYPQLMFVLNQLLNKPLKENEIKVRALMLVGLFQLMYMRIPVHASIYETVAAAHDLKKPWSRSLINAVLRNYLRSQETLQKQIAQHESAQYAHPEWLIAAIKRAWPRHWESILRANNQQPPLSVRVNAAKMSRHDYIKAYGGEPIHETVAGVLLDSNLSPEKIPGLKEGFVSVQDASAQYAATLLALAPHQRVLDACAAPGGKLTHILELEPTLAYCLAIDNDQQRVARIHENLKRVAVHADVICTDAMDTASYAHGESFDRILCDAPCSATGVIRRHPDIKILRQQKDISANAKQQLQLLNALWPLLKKEGVLLYVTCSILPEENVDVIKKFLAEHEDAKPWQFELGLGEACDLGWQILPTERYNCDGFYYARLRKQ